MGNKLLFLFLFLSIINLTFADQLAYLSKKDAERAVSKLSKYKSFILFCGCCENDVPLEITPLKIYYKYTGYEDYYEITIEYTKDDGIIQKVEIDLAYTWVKVRKKYQTVGQLLKLKHDVCNSLNTRN